MSKLLRANRKRKYAFNPFQIVDGWNVRLRKDGTIKERISKYVVNHKKDK